MTTTRDSLPIRILVVCDFADDIVPARLESGKYFCSCCGSTDHTEVK